jgi:malate dehydrogenase (oxaloacetate-decarboxylating)
LARLLSRGKARLARLPAPGKARRDFSALAAQPRARHDAAVSGRPRLSPFFDLVRDPSGATRVETSISGMALLRLALLNKGTAFTREERSALGLEGLLPPEVNTLEVQVERISRDYRRVESPLSKYQFLRSLQERQEILFYALLERQLAEMLPIVYTPTVGDAVLQFSTLYQNPRGISVSTHDVARTAALLDNYPIRDVRMIVATDSSAILGLGDQGYGGLAIPIGKLALYVVAGGVSPFHTLPVSLDVGTDRKDLVTDPLYLGTRHARLRGDAYFQFMDEFVAGLEARMPQAIVQWEDLAKEAAFAVLERYRRRIPSFNDDIQGTGAMALAGVTSASAITGVPLADQRVVISGAGAAGVGVAWALREGLVRAGLSREEATRRLWLLDSQGLLHDGRDIEAYKRPFAQPSAVLDGGPTLGLEAVVRRARPTVLIGLSGQRGSFDEGVVRAMAAAVDRPVIFPMSNPTSITEAVPDDLYRWTDGRAVVATGSPFPDVAWGGRSIAIGQGNNAFIFPGLGLGAIVARAREVTDAMVLDASDALARYSAERAVPAGMVYPPVSELREVALSVAVAVARRAQLDGVAAEALPEDDAALTARVRQSAWQAKYLPTVRVATGQT